MPAGHDVETVTVLPEFHGNNTFGLRGHGDIALHVFTFSVWTCAVAVLTFLICRNCFPVSKSASEDYFAGGRQLTWSIIAGSLMLTNLSTEQLVGLNGAIFKDGCLAGTGWETFAALAMCATASVFVPKYVSLGLTTTTGFLGERFDLMTRTIVSTLFLLYYTFGLCPSVLYTGALAFRNIFDLDIPLWIVSLVIGLIGACYALFGGLKAVAVSDCLNGIGLIMVGLWVPIAALLKLGGLQTLFEKPSYLQPLVETGQIYHDHGNYTGLRTPGEVSLPWSTYITGLTLNNLYYWSTNQLIVQRVLGAKSLADAQKGVLFAAAMKVVGFTFLCLPGIIGMLMLEKGPTLGYTFQVKKADEVYPELVKFVMPKWSLGFFAAVLLGSVLSTFNSALNSASTLFGLELYKIYTFQRRDQPISVPTDENVVKVAGVFGASLTVASLLIAPQLESVESIFDFLQRVKTLCSLPVITIFLVGILFRRPDAFAAKTAFVVGAIIYGAGTFLEHPHFLHVFFVCFLVAAAVMFSATYWHSLRKCFGMATPKPFVEKKGLNFVDMTPWPALYPVIGIITILVVLLTVSLQIGSPLLFITFGVLWLVGIAALMLWPISSSREEEEEEDEAEEEEETEVTDEEESDGF